MRRRIVVLLAAAALAAVLAVSAAAAHQTRVVVEFARLPLGPKSAFAVFERHGLVLAARARRAAVIHWRGRRDLLVAPMQGGRFCKSLNGPYGGAVCYTKPPRLDPGSRGDRAGPILLNGAYTNPRGVRLRLTYEDGARADIPITWVGPPIKAGLFVFPIPRRHRIEHHRPQSLTLFSAHGVKLVARNLRR